MAKKLDVKKLLEEADCREVAEAIGIETLQKGANVFCECVNEEHEEGSQFEHAVLYEKGFHCFSCGANYDVIDMVRHYYAKTGRSISFIEACNVIAEIYGGKEFFKGSASVSRFPLSKEEIKTIGLAPDDLWMASYCGEKKPEMSLRLLYRDDPEAFSYLIKNKAAEYGLRYKKMSEQAGQLGGEFAPYLKAAADKKRRECYKIYLKFGGKEKRTSKLYAI